MSSDLVDIFVSYALQFPLYIVWIVGMVLSLVRMQRHPKVSILVLVALSGFFFLSMVTPWAWSKPRRKARPSPASRCNPRSTRLVCPTMCQPRFSHVRTGKRRNRSGKTA